MPMRFKLLVVFFAVLMLAMHSGSLQMAMGVKGVFLGLAALLVLSIMALWPNGSRADRVERNISRAGWADRIDIESLARDRRGDAD